MGDKGYPQKGRHTVPIHQNAKQCAYTKVNGHRCGGPAKAPSDFCFHHEGLKDRFGKEKVTVPPLDDQNAIQVAIMDVINGLLSKRLERADAYTVLYGIQIARANLRGLTLVQLSSDEAAEQLVYAEVLAARQLATIRATERAKAEARAQTMTVARLQLDGALAQAAASREKEREKEAAARRKEDDDSDQSLAEYLLRCLSEDSNQQQQSEINEVLIHHGKKPLTAKPSETQDRDTG